MTYMNASEVIALLDRDDSDSVKSYNSECIDLLEPTEELDTGEELEEEAEPKPKVNK